MRKLLILILLLLSQSQAFADNSAKAVGGGAPSDATYITQTASTALSAEQNLSALSSGIMRVATTTGVVTALTDSAGIAANISDETGTGVEVFSISPTITTPTFVTTATIQSGTGISLASGTAGVLTVAGLSGSAENLILDLGATANTGVITSGTGLNILKLGNGAVGDIFYHDINGRTFFGYDGPGTNAVVQGGSAKGIEFNVNNATFATGTVATFGTTGVDFNLILDDFNFTMGAGTDIEWQWDTAETNDSYKLGLKVNAAADSGNFIICEFADINTNFAVPAVVDPHLRIQSSDATSTSDFIQLWHDQTDANIEAGTGAMNLIATSVVVTALNTGNGALELYGQAVASDINTGTDTTKSVTSDALAGSVMGEKVAEIVVTDFTTDTATGDGQYYFVVPSSVSGMNLVGVAAQVITAGTTNATNVDLARCDTTTTGNACSGTVADMLSTNITIDTGENSTASAATPAVIDTSNDDVTTGEIVRVDVDGVSTTAAKGLIVVLVFRLP